MEFREVVRRRRMVRRYGAEPVDPAALDRILDAARRGPSAGFTQGQSFVVVTDPGLRRSIADLSREAAYVARGFDPWLSQAPVIVVVCTSEQAYRDRYGEPDKLGPSGELSWDVPFWHVDAGAALMLLLLAVVDEGYAAGFLVVKDEAGLRALLGIPDEVQPIGLVTIGKPAPDRPSQSLKRGRKPEGEVIHRERW
jgi:nitroreductase